MAVSTPGLVVVLVVIVSACGGGGHSVATTNGHPDPQQLVSKIECRGYVADPQTTMFAASTGSCDYGNGGSVQIDTFASAAAEQRYQSVADQVGRQGDLIYGDRWAVQASTADDAVVIQRRIGGTIH